MNFKVTENNDDYGRKYVKVWYPERQESVVSYNGSNHIFIGVPRMVLRTGDSSFGEQIFFDLFDTNYKGKLKQNTKYNTSEFYLGKLNGMEFLEYSLDVFRKKI